MRRQLTVCIYKDYPSQSLDTREVAEFLAEYGINSGDRGDLLGYLGAPPESLYRAAEVLSGSRITDIETPLDTLRPAAGSGTASEIKILAGEESPRGIFYDGLWLQRVLRKVIMDALPDESGDGYLHLVFTGRLIGTFEDRRYHARVVLLGSPAIISSPGLVEAPARPREYHFIKGGLLRSGRDTRELDDMYKGRFMDYDDPKTTSALSSYALQAVFYELTGRAFCGNSECCLYNSHLQEDVLRVQCGGKPCPDCLKLMG